MLFRSVRSHRARAHLAPPFPPYSPTTPLKMSKVNDLALPFPLIDADPHAKRVISYMRGSDYALWAAGTAAGPGAIYAFGTLLRRLYRVRN